MCRLLLALGEFSVSDTIDSAISMSLGKTSVESAPIKAHQDGWGMVWYDPNTAKIKHILSDKPISTSIDNNLIKKISTHFLAMHVRNATLPHTIGLEYAHPIIIERPLGFFWYLMHNGFLPTVYEKLNLPHSRFDSREYSDYVIPHSRRGLNKREVFRKLQDLRSEGTAANAFVINSKYVYIIHWHMPDCSINQEYFTLYTASNKKTLYFASEIQTNLLPATKWSKVPLPSVKRYKITERFNL